MNKSNIAIVGTYRSYLKNFWPNLNKRRWRRKSFYSLEELLANNHEYGSYSYEIYNYKSPNFVFLFLLSEEARKKRIIDDRHEGHIISP